MVQFFWPTLYIMSATSVFSRYLSLFQAKCSKIAGGRDSDPDMLSGSLRRFPGGRLLRDPVTGWREWIALARVARSHLIRACGAHSSTECWTAVQIGAVALRVFIFHALTSPWSLKTQVVLRARLYSLDRRKTVVD